MTIARIETSLPVSSRNLRFKLYALWKLYAYTRRDIKESNQLKRQHGSFRVSDINRLAMRWSKDVLDLFNVEVTLRGTPLIDTPALLVGNHISYLDMPLICTATPTAFVSKIEAKYFPVFGACARRAGTVFVKRGSQKSRNQASRAIAKAILNDGKRIGIFPSGTTCLDESKPWRWGAFKIAKNNGIPVQPFRLRYHPLREAAYIDRDFLPYHLWNLLNLERIEAYLEFHDPVQITNPQQDAEYWWKWTREPIVI